ncbi:MAG TPA: hypothetical protein VF787_04790 [Thermoanaerobaculia bacterium]
MIPLLASAQTDQRLRDRDPELLGAKKVTGELQEANFHNGPWYLLSRFRIADAGYTQSSYVPTGDESGLSLSVEAPHRLYFVPHKKTIFSAEFTPGYSFFNQNKEQRQLNYLARADAHFLFNHLYLDVYTLKSDQLRAHVADINRLATQVENETGVAGEVKYSSRTSAIFSARYRETEYPDDRFQPTRPNGDEIPVYLLERNERNARLSINHKTFPLTSLFVASEVSNYGFKNATYMDSNRIYYGGGLSYDNGRTSFRVEGGPMKLDFDDPNQRDYDGILARAEASRGNGRWNFSVGGDRDIGFSIFDDNSFYVATSAHTGVEYAATRRLTLRSGIIWERDRYETEVAGLKRMDEYSFSSVGFSYGIKRLRTGLDVGWYERESTAFGDEDDGIRYVLHLSYTP